MYNEIALFAEKCGATVIKDAPMKNTQVSDVVVMQVFSLYLIVLKPSKK